jgi:uncharacterized membrane protein YgcG
MNEEQLADLLAQHLDTLLEGGALPEELPAEVAELLTVAQSLSEAAPAPRPEFGPLLQESLLGPTGGSNGAPPRPGAALSGQAISMVVVGLLAGAAILAVLISLIIYGAARSNLSEASPTPAQATLAPATLTPTPEPTVTSQATSAAPTPTVTTTPIIDVLPAITVTVELPLPPDLVPGSGGSGDAGDSGGGSSGGGDSGSSGGGGSGDDDGGDD